MKNSVRAFSKFYRKSAVTIYNESQRKTMHISLMENKNKEQIFISFI